MSEAADDSTLWGAERGARVEVGDCTLVFYHSFTRAAGDVELFHVELGDTIFTAQGIGIVLSLFSFGDREGVEVRLMARARALATPRPYHGAAELLLTNCFAIMPLSMVEGPVREPTAGGSVRVLTIAAVFPLEHGCIHQRSEVRRWPFLHQRSGLCHQARCS